MELSQKGGNALRGLRINREILILRKPLIEVEYCTIHLPESTDSRVSTLFTTLIIPIYLIIDRFPVQR